MTEKRYTSLGITAFILGLIGIAIIWVPFISLSGIVLAILAIIFGAISYWGKLKDLLGLVGFILGLITIILVIVSFIIAASLYFTVTNLTDGTTGSSSPTLAWSVD